MPPTRREQLELDELLSDIYLGIETLPDRSAGSRKHYNHPNTANNQYSYNSSPKTADRQAQDFSTNATRESNRREGHSLASIVTSSNSSTTPRRVRIVEPPDKRSREVEEREEPQVATSQQYPPIKSFKNLLVNDSRKPEVKYINTNKLIYHHERDSDDSDHNYRESSYYNQDHHLVTKGKNYDSEEEERKERGNDFEGDFDGKTRVKYYHNTWLERQLGRVSRRRSSKELTEREIKEKAMIEELKRNLKNGAITLRQSFKKKDKNNNSLDFYDLDSSLDANNNDDPYNYKQKAHKYPVAISGLATLPRKPIHRQQNKSDHLRGPPNKPTTLTNSSNNSQSRKVEEYSHRTSEDPVKMQTRQEANVSYSHTLPHKRNEHQLLQSHYRGANIYNTSNTYNPNKPASVESSRVPAARSYNSNTIEVTRTNYTLGRSPNPQQQRQQPPHPAAGETISSLPSATEVVRSALSRSESSTDVSQLNRTINLLPSSPSPACPPQHQQRFLHSPTTPTQQLRAASPSPLSPSPVCGLQNQQHQSQAFRAHEQPVYANPHAALMQHRADELQRKQNRNQASIREFNELDSLLRSLSPASTMNTTTHVSAGYSSNPAPASIGFGGLPSQQQQRAQAPTGAARLTGQRVIPAQQTDLYARVHKAPAFGAGNSPQVNNEQTKASYLQQNYLQQNMTAGRDEFTIDVTNNKLRQDDDCLRNQNLSEFEPPIDLVPSMEDYQNISKLNPVKNHYWYKPHMSRERAIELLKDKPQGTFIVRDSTSFQGAYGLAVKVARLPKNVLNNASLRNPNDPSAELIRHFLIEPTPGGVRLKGYANELIFGTLPDLIYQHSLVELALPCKLVIPRADIEDRNFNLKQKQFYDEFLASKEIAKHMPYEIKSPDGGYRRYPGDVYVHNEHRIIYE